MRAQIYEFRSFPAILSENIVQVEAVSELMREGSSVKPKG